MDSHVVEEVNHGILGPRGTRQRLQSVNAIKIDSRFMNKSLWNYDQVKSSIRRLSTSPATKDINCNSICHAHAISCNSSHRQSAHAAHSIQSSHCDQSNQSI